MKINTTKHSEKRRNKRGISKDMVSFTIEHGIIKGEKYITNKKIIQKFLIQLDEQLKKLSLLNNKFNDLKVTKLINEKIRQSQDIRKIALKICDKGGVTVIYAGNSIITAYNTDSHNRRKNY